MRSIDLTEITIQGPLCTNAKKLLDEYELDVPLSVYVMYLGRNKKD